MKQIMSSGQKARLCAGPKMKPMSKVGSSSTKAKIAAVGRGARKQKKAYASLANLAKKKGRSG